MSRLAGLALAAFVAACGPSAPEGVDEAALNEAIGTRLGDPGLCVLIADADGELSYRYGSNVTCGRLIQSCIGEARSAKDGLNAAIDGQFLAISCPSLADGSRGAGWVLGRTPVRKLPFAAAMESARALPGVEMQLRLETAFREQGL